MPLVVVAVAAALYVIVSAVDWFIGRNTFNDMTEEERDQAAENRVDESLMTETDKEMAAETARCIRRVIGDPATDGILALDSEQRERASTELITELCGLYGVELNEIVYYDGSPNICGSYIHNSGTIKLNIKYLMCGSRACIFEYIDTVVHELRHAVQWSVLKGNKKWNTPDDVQQAWHANIFSYTRFEDDPLGYFAQPIEQDAFTFGYFATKGVR